MIPPCSQFQIRLQVAVAGFLCAFGLLGCGRPEGGASPTTNSAVAVPKIELRPLTNMVLIKAGSFMRQRHPVTITRDFWLARFEVTQGEYLSVMGRNPSHFPGDTNRPVEKISCVDAENYCAAITKAERGAGRLPADYSYRLPTEAEWEYACRAGSTNLFHFGDDAALADKYAWTMENAEGQTHPVGQKLPNAWGLYDMHGNVWEWCSDWFAEFPKEPVVDPKGAPPGKFKVFRGGGWNHAVEFARSRNRFMMSPTNGIYFVGLRVALGKAD